MCVFVCVYTSIYISISIFISISTSFISVYIPIYLSDTYFKELAHVTMGADRSKLCRAGWKLSQGLIEQFPSSSPGKLSFGSSGLSSDWMKLAHIIHGDSGDRRWSPHLQKTFTATPRFLFD